MPASKILASVEALLSPVSRKVMLYTCSLMTMLLSFASSNSSGWIGFRIVTTTRSSNRILFPLIAV